MVSHSYFSHYREGSPVSSRAIVCPACHQKKFERIRRELWMRLLPRTRLYLCLHCDARFLTFFQRFSLRIR